MTARTLAASAVVAENVPTDRGLAPDSLAAEAAAIRSKACAAGTPPSTDALRDHDLPSIANSCPIAAIFTPVFKYNDTALIAASIRHRTWPKAVRMTE